MQYFASVIKTDTETSFTSNDVEWFDVRYKVVGLGKGETMASFSSKNNVPSNKFIKLYKKNASYKPMQHIYSDLRHLITNHEEL